jgi:hypothetical protein
MAEPSATGDREDLFGFSPRADGPVPRRGTLVQGLQTALKTASSFPLADRRPASPPCRRPRRLRCAAETSNTVEEATANDQEALDLYVEGGS